MTTASMRLGSFGESVARSHLTKIGYRVLDANVRLRHGEVDIVAEDGGETVFVEVRTRRGRAFGAPEESISRRKAERMVRAAVEFLNKQASHFPRWRIDVVAVDITRDGRVSRVDVLKGAVGEAS